MFFNVNRDTKSTERAIWKDFMPHFIAPEKTKKPKQSDDEKLEIARKIASAFGFNLSTKK